MERTASNHSPFTIYYSLLFDRVGVDVREKLLGRGLGALVGELDGALDLLADAGFDLLEAVVVEDALLAEVVAEDLDGVALLILLDLGARAVVAGVGHRVAHEAVGADFEERRQVLFARTLDGALGGRAHGEDVH